jgi:probable rRNA maturation factor
MPMKRPIMGAARRAVTKLAATMAGRPPGVHIEIAVEAGGWPDRETMEALVTRAIDATVSALAELSFEPDLALADGGELSVLLTDDDGIKVLNERFRGRGTATNVLSFPAAGIAGPHAPALGDIALAWETVAGEAVSRGLTIDQHVTHLVIHGFLHILGFDHDDDGHAARMERLEINILAALGIADPYGDAPADLAQ